MNAHMILLPVCAEMILIFLVWAWMYYVRISEIKKNQIHPQKLADGQVFDTLLKNGVNSSDNFENQFEIPILFFLAMILIFEIATSDILYLSLAWAFVVLRGVHSYIHCTYNKIIHRFSTYFLGTIILWIIWARLIAQIIRMSF